MKKLQLILENNNKEWYGRIEGIGNFMPVSCAPSVEEVEKGIRNLIKDHQENDEPDEWEDINADKVVFEHGYDLTDLFNQFSVLKISSIAKMAEMPPSLLRQYVTHKKFPGKDQAMKIEKVIKNIAQRLSDIVIDT